MKETDINYLCTVIGNLIGVPIRVYEDGSQTFYHSAVKLSKDPICVCLESLL